MIQFMLRLGSAVTQNHHMIDVRLVDYLTLDLEAAKAITISDAVLTAQEYAVTVVAAAGAAVQA